MADESSRTVANGWVDSVAGTLLPQALADFGAFQLMVRAKFSGAYCDLTALSVIKRFADRPGIGALPALRVPVRALLPRICPGRTCN